MNKKNLLLAVFALCGLSTMQAEPVLPEFDENNGTQEKIYMFNFGNFDQWITRNIQESGIIGGKTQTIYAIGPTATWNSRKPYLGAGGSPWATSNVLAHVAGIYKTNCSVYKEARAGHGFCAKLTTHVVGVTVAGVVNVNVLAAGSIFLGQMLEPITGASNPMRYLNYGLKFDKKPTAICLDYKVKLSDSPNRIKQNGMGSPSTVKGRDYADCIVYLQKRWEDEKGNIYAHRVGTMVYRFTKTSDWKNNQKFTIHYGDITKESFYKSYMGLTSGNLVRYAKNSKGKMVPIQEVGWGSADDTPTHLCIQMDSSHGGAYVGSEGNTLWVDNVRLVY